jgi:AmiR/NasT family two-component response regulator
VLTETIVSLQNAQAVEQPVLHRDAPVSYRAEIHQASGMVAVQLGISPDQAMLLIRDHTVAQDLTVLAVATEIVGRRLRIRDVRPGV